MLNKNLKCVISVISFLFAANAGAQVTTKNNGVIAFDSNANGVPMISEIRILGTAVMKYDNVGAGFQMTARSSAGNAYNPTQAGDCRQHPSQVLSFSSNWSPSGLQLNAQNGVMFNVAPRDYAESTSCASVGGVVLPFQFEFGATLGDAVSLPKELMVLDLYYTRQQGAEIVQKGQSEAPVIFPMLNVMPYAYSSVDGSTIVPFNVVVNGAPTNDVRKWPIGPNQYTQGKLIMMCTLSQTNCIGLYSNKETINIFSRRAGAKYPLSMLALTIDSGGEIADFDRHHARKLLVVGTPSTIATVISQASSAISDWGDL